MTRDRGGPGPSWATHGVEGGSSATGKTPGGEPAKCHGPQPICVIPERVSKVRRRMGFAKKAFVAAGVGFAAAALVGCGSSGRLLSETEDSTLRNELNHVSTALTDGQCQSADQWLADFQNKLASLGGVNSTLLNNL